MADTNLLVLAREFKKLRTDVKEVLQMPVGPQGLQGEKGEKGDKGDPGSAGQDGKDGINGKDGVNGLDGVNGKDGIDGEDGKDGVSVTDAYIDFDGSLVLKLSNGNEINAGEVSSEQAASVYATLKNGAASLNELLPSQTGNSGKVLTTDGTNASWGAPSGGMVYPAAGIAVSTGTAWNGSLTAPSGALVGTTDIQTLTNKTISGASNTLSNIGNSSLTNSSVTINGSAISLGGSATVTAVNPNALTIGTGLSGTSYNGSSAVTVAIDSTVATLTGTQTLTNKTLTNPTVTNYVETPYTANTSTAITLDLANGTVQILTLTGNATITMPTAVAGKSFIIDLKTGTGGFSVTWTTVKWPAGTAPTVTSTASKMDIYSFFSDGTNWYGTTVGQNYTP